MRRARCRREREVMYLVAVSTQGKPVIYQLPLPVSDLSGTRGTNVKRVLYTPNRQQTDERETRAALQTRSSAPTCWALLIILVVRHCQYEETVLANPFSAQTLVQIQMTSLDK